MRKVEPSLMVKKDGMILEKPPFGQRETEGFEKYHLNIFSPPSSSIRKDFQSPSIPDVSYPIPKD